MRGTVLILGALLVSAGCIGASLEPAKSLEEQAQERAEERIEEPELVAVYGLEPPHHDEDEEGRFWLYLDETPGDGKAPGWAYHFVGAEEEGVVIVSAAAGILAEAWAPLPDPSDDEDLERAYAPGAALSHWEVDAVEVAESLAANESWPAVNESWMVGWELGMQDGWPMWVVEADPSFAFWGTDHRAVVNATSGQIISVTNGEEPDRQVPAAGSAPEEHAEGGCSQDSDSGLVSPIQSLETEAELGGQGWLELVVQRTGAGSLTLTVFHEEERVVFEDTTGPLAEGTTYHTGVDGLPPGDYTFEVTAPQGASQATVDLKGYWGQPPAECFSEGSGQASGQAVDGFDAEAWAWQQLETQFGAR